MYFKKMEEFLITHYYLFIIGGYFLRIITEFRPGLFILILNVLLLGCHIIVNIRNHRIKVTSVTFFTLCLFLSVIMFLWNDQSLSVYINSAIYVITPIVCYLTTPETMEGREKFYKSYLTAITINNIFGIICFYLKPGFYVDYVYRTSSAAYEQVMHHAGYGRLITLFGSIETGVLAGVGVLVGILLLQRYKKDKLIIVAIIVNFAAVILSQQRGPFFSLVLLLGFIIVYSTIKGKRVINPLIPILIIAVFIGTMFFLYTYKHTVFNWMVERLTNPSAAINDRYDYQWDVVKNGTNIIQWLFGKGVGHVGFFIEDTAISKRIWDNMYFNMLAEIGILGFSLFLFTFLRCFRVVISDINKNALFFAPVFAIAFQGMGTSMNYYPQIMGMFWFSVGCLYHYLGDAELNVNNSTNGEIEHGKEYSF